ncbi:hypothetical protein FOZ62_012854, partial [Perkinsus olseni]
EEDPDSVEAQEELQKRDLEKALAGAIERCTHLDSVVDKTIRQRAVTEAESLFANEDEDETWRALMDYPSDAGGSPAVLQEAQGRVRDPPPCRPIEVSLMVEIGAGKIFPGQVYSPHATTRTLCYNKLIESFGDCLNVVNAANEIAGSSG